MTCIALSVMTRDIDINRCEPQNSGKKRRQVWRQVRFVGVFHKPRVTSLTTPLERKIGPSYPIGRIDSVDKYPARSDDLTVNPTAWISQIYSETLRPSNHAIPEEVCTLWKV
jgi:hypothetical protein